MVDKIYTFFVIVGVLVMLIFGGQWEVFRFDMAGLFLCITLYVMGLVAREVVLDMQDEKDEIAKILKAFKKFKVEPFRLLGNCFALIPLVLPVIVFPFSIILMAWLIWMMRVRDPDLLKKMDIAEYMIIQIPIAYFFGISTLLAGTIFFVMATNALKK